MKRKIVLIIVVILGAVAAYLWGYYSYKMSNPEVLNIDSERSVNPDSIEYETSESQYFLLKIEEDMLKIYQMPERTLYDSVNVNTLQLYEEKEALMKGKVIKSLPEVFEFLENLMS